MRLTSCFLISAAASLVHSTPIDKRTGITDVEILNYALTLEHLEATFYRQGLKNFTQADFLAAGFLDPFYSNLQQVALDEMQHVEFLTKALKAAGATPVAACTYDFGVTDAKSFVMVGNLLEGIGVAAYLGAAAHLANKEYLTDAGSILTVEARHSSYFRASIGEVPFRPFDDPLDFDEVYTLAAPLIVSCPKSNPTLPVKAFPTLTVVSHGNPMTGSMVKLQTGKGYKSHSTSGIFAAFITVTGPVWAPLKPEGHGEYIVTIPEGIMGQSYVVLTKGHKEVTDDNIVAGPAIIEVGPIVGTPC